MMVVGLTGGIGSGKTTVAKEFEALGVPVYIADVEAKKLMVTSEVIKEKLVQLFGEEVYVNGELNKPFIANIIFNDKTYLQKMNAIVHPEVGKHFESWKEKQNTSYVIKEVAILFENGGNKQCDLVITVTAPMHLRIERLLKRDHTTKEKIEAIIKNQWSDEEKIALSDFVVNNVNFEETKEQVMKIHEQIVKTL
ncbi:dephospho-CoA kinase [Aestuariibaculum lutulentum]|uniref:Dephospho-CoA kinase n=1 Tax=Aestuariibaculum lutulentum TaxID=2920935 RepID=A0ABS9RJ56_9FLAO|nr:dephospho-CoA kinase [Aestuariibaculum lutulentum]MCH4552990.1 dephospho-CoA kinase [Aestuariibaculum lutulentum]